MKKLKSILVSLSLVLCFLFLTACGGGGLPKFPNQLNSKPTINTSGEYNTTLTKEEFDNELTKNSGDETENKETILEYDANVTGIQYYMKANLGGIPIEFNTIMKFTNNKESMELSQVAMKINMNMSFGTTQPIPVEIYAFIKDINEKKLYTQTKMSNIIEKGFYTFDSFDDVNSSGMEDMQFDLTNIYEIINNYTTGIIDNLNYKKTEKDANGIVKYNLSYNAIGETNTTTLLEEYENNSTMEAPTYSNVNIYLIVKEVEDKAYFQGFSVEAKGQSVQESASMNFSAEMIVSLFSGNIEFPDFNDYTFVSHINGQNTVI